MYNKIGKVVVVMRHGQDLTSFKYGTIVGSRNWGNVISRVATLLGFSQIAIVNSGYRSVAYENYRCPQESCKTATTDKYDNRPAKRNISSDPIPIQCWCHSAHQSMHYTTYTAFTGVL